MSALGLVGYGYDDDEEEEDDDQEEDKYEDSLADALNRGRERENSATERPLSALDSGRDRTDQGEKNGTDEDWRDSRNGAVLHEVPEGALGETTPPAPGGDVVMVDCPSDHEAGDGKEQFVIPSAPPWSVPGIPDAPEQKCDAKWQSRIVWILEQQEKSGKQMVAEMQRNKTYRNPRFMQKHIEEKTVDQYGTCFPPDVWDPNSLPKHDFLIRIRREMRDIDKMKRVKAAANNAAQAAKVSAQRMHPASMPASAARASAALNSGTKRSKWDQTR